MKVFSEIGIGNDSYLSTEFEKSDGSEYRFIGFFVYKIVSVYIRLWVGYQVLIIDSKEGFKSLKKTKKRVKALIGVQSQ